MKTKYWVNLFLSRREKTDNFEFRCPKKSFFSDERSIAATASSQTSERRWLEKEAAIVRKQDEVEIERRKLELSRARKKRELELKQIELAAEAEFVPLTLKTKL